jgi:hypothetical protein
MYLQQRTKLEVFDKTTNTLPPIGVKSLIPFTVLKTNSNEMIQ